MTLLALLNIVKLQDNLQVSVMSISNDNRQPPTGEAQLLVREIIQCNAGTLIAGRKAIMNVLPAQVYPNHMKTLKRDVSKPKDF